jgi:hypothetical protein
MSRANRFADVKPRVDTGRERPSTGPDWKGVTSPSRSRSLSVASQVSSFRRGASVAASRTLVESPSSSTKANQLDEELHSASPGDLSVINSRLLALLSRQIKTKSPQSDPPTSLSSEKEYYTIVHPRSSELILARPVFLYGSSTPQT